MIPKEIIKEVRRIEIATNRMVNDVFAGSYHSVFKGRGMEFDEVREYTPGDDVRSIDWNVTARMGHPFIKKFTEERELTLILMLDISGSSHFASVNKLKSRIAAEICSILALSAKKNNDKVGLIAFTDKVELFVPPAKGMRHMLRIIREALYFTPENRGTNISAALEYLSKVISRRAVVFLVSDFYDDDYKKALSIAHKRHDLIALSITDPHEIELPGLGLIQFEDAETGKEHLIDTSSKKTREQFRKNAQILHDKRSVTLRRLGIDHINIHTDDEYSKALFQFFNKRQRRLKT